MKFARRKVYIVSPRRNQTEYGFHPKSDFGFDKSEKSWMNGIQFMAVSEIGLRAEVF